MFSLLKVIQQFQQFKQSFYVISKQSNFRAYFPASKWDAIKSELLSIHSQLKMGEVSDFSIFVSAVIDENSFDRIEAHIQAAKDSDKCEIIAGGNCDKSKGIGYFVINLKLQE